MKQKKYFMLAAAAALFAACSSDDGLVAEKQAAAQEAGDGAIVFDAYQSRSTTRAGATGTMDLSKLQTFGFGVFSYYTNNEGFSELAKPDFMYNQKVSYSDGWTYAPLKYWPNEFGTEAASERVDYLSFFAYAPYVDSDPKTGKVATKSNETGITGMIRNTAIGDPLVKYVAAFDPAKCVDLCWGVVAENFVESVTGTAPTNDLKAGKPWIDVIKPLSTSKIKFDFKHALAQLNVQIDADIDDDSHGHATEVNTKTRIYVRSVSFEGFTDKGTLNLNSDATAADYPIWYDVAGTGNLSTTPITIYDGRYDGREGVANVAAPAESPLGLNSKLIQSKAYVVTPPDFESVAEEPGVTKSAVNLFNSVTLDEPILVIPNGQPLTIKVVYDVETYDPTLAPFLSDGKTHGSTIENAITKTITLSPNGDMILKSGKKHTVKLHLGLTSVKFDASVSPWTTSPAGEGNGDLPINNGTAPAAAAANGESLSTTMSASGGIYAFTFTGATGTLVRKAGDATDGATVSGTGEDASITVPANNTPATKVYTVNVNDDSGTPQEVTVTITQAPAALGLSVATPALGAGTTFKLGSNATVDDWSAATVNKTFTRTRGAATSTITPSSVAADGTVTLAEAAQGGDVYTITVQAGNAAAETVSFTVAKAAGTLNAFASTNVDYSIVEPTTLNQTTTVSTGSDGTITYSIDKKSGTGATSASIVPNTGVVTLTSATAGDVFTVTATVTDGINYTYADKKKTYTITIIP